MFNLAQCSNGTSFHTHNGTGTNDGIFGRHGDCCGVSVKMGGCHSDDTRWRRDMCMRSEDFGDHLRRGLQPTAAYSVVGIGHRAHATAIYSVKHLKRKIGSSSDGHQ